jgi:hypothetical protein
MSKLQLSLLPMKSNIAGNMATVLDVIMGDETIPWEKRMNIRWAFGCFAKACGCPLRQIPAELRQVQIPIHRGQLLRFDRGQATDLIAATIPI